MMDDELERRFTMFVKLSADSPEQLRRCDVWRVVEASANAGLLMAFCRWLATKRPELAHEIAECGAECNGWKDESCPI